MFGRFMNNYFYGKSGKGDYTREDLPSTRLQLFWETLRTRMGGLMRLNLLYMLVWLPAMLVIVHYVMEAYSVLAGFSEMQAQAGTVTAEALAAGQAAFTGALNGVAIKAFRDLIPCLAITGPFTAGLCFVTRNWARDEHAFVWSDFKDAALENWKQALLTSVITGVVPLITYLCWMFYGEMAKNNALFMIAQMLTVTLGVLWCMSLLYTYPLMVTYRLRYRDVLRNSLLLTVGRLPATLLIKLLSCVPVAIAAAVGVFTPYLQWALMICLLYYAAMGFALSRFVGASYANAMFDKYINVKIEGAQINRGLYRDDDADEPDGEHDARP